MKKTFREYPYACGYLYFVIIQTINHFLGGVIIPTILNFFVCLVLSKMIYLVRVQMIHEPSPLRRAYRHGSFLASQVALLALVNAALILHQPLLAVYLAIPLVLGCLSDQFFAEVEEA